MEKHRAYQISLLGSTGGVTIICVISKTPQQYLVAEFTVLVSSFDDSSFQIPYIGADISEDESFKLTLRCLWKATRVINVNDDEVEFIKKMVELAFGASISMTVEAIR